jgi:glycosyltransferase involved in cell wall biosynthesis
MKALILYSGKFPGTSASAKRINFFKEGLIAANLPTDILSIGKLTTGRLAYYLNLFYQPFRTAVIFFKARKKYNLAYIYGFGWVTYLLLAMLGRYSGIKLYLEVNEKLGSMYGNRFTELKLVKFFTNEMTKLTYLFFDGFIVISDALEAYLKPYVSSRARIINIPIIIDNSRDLSCIEKPFVEMPYLLHTGALSDRKDGIAEVFEAFAIACNALNKQLHFYLTSKLAPRDLWQSIQKVIKENGLEQNVHFLGEIPEQQLLSLQKYCSMVIINKHRNEQNLYNFPTKLGEYLVFEKPVITTGVGEMGKYFVDRVNVYLFPLHDVKAMADNIIYVIKYPNESSKVGLRGKEIAAAHFDHIIQGKILSEFFTQNAK